MTSMSPSILHFHITPRCPFNCKHCCSESGDHNDSVELDRTSIIEMLDKATRFGMDEIDISGGEPLIIGKYPIVEIIAYASKRNLISTINTNTWFLDEHYVSDLKDAGLDRIKCSLYGTSPGTHDDFTGTEGSFKMVMNALTFLKDTNIEVWIHYVVTPKNLEETFALPSLLDPYDIGTIQLSSIIPSGRGTGAREYLFSDLEMESLITSLESMFSNFINNNIFFTIALYPQPDTYPFNDRFCDYLQDRLVVDSSGRIIPCCILPKEIRSVNGNIITGDFEEIISSRKTHDDPIFYWLGKGHKAMREVLGFEKSSHNLCSICIEMLTILQENTLRAQR